MMERGMMSAAIWGFGTYMAAGMVTSEPMYRLIPAAIMAYQYS